VTGPHRVSECCGLDHGEVDDDQGGGIGWQGGLLGLYAWGGGGGGVGAGQWAGRGFRAWRGGLESGVAAETRDEGTCTGGDCWVMGWSALDEDKKRKGGFAERVSSLGHPNVHDQGTSVRERHALRPIFHFHDQSFDHLSFLRWRKAALPCECTGKSGKLIPEDNDNQGTFERTLRTKYCILLGTALANNKRR
jgi:hypothetical protein